MVRTCWHLRQNPEFIQAVVTGQQHVSDLASMDVKEMASESMKKQRGKYHENAKMALMDTKSFEKYIGKEINDGILKCPKCKSMKTEYTEVQTRSADEPTTKKCFCNSCNYRWKCAASHCAHMKAHTSRLPSPSIPCHQVLLTLCGSISHVFFLVGRSSRQQCCCCSTRDSTWLKASQQKARGRGWLCVCTGVGLSASRCRFSCIRVPFPAISVFILEARSRLISHDYVD